MAVSIEGYLLVNFGMNFPRSTAIIARKPWARALAAGYLRRGVGGALAALAQLAPLRPMRSPPRGGWHGLSDGCPGHPPDSVSSALQGGMALLGGGVFLGGVQLASRNVFGSAGAAAFAGGALLGAGALAAATSLRRKRPGDLGSPGVIAAAGGEARFRALIDTGNRLREPFSGLASAHLRARVLADVLPGDYDDLAAGESLPGFRRVGYGALGGGGHLNCFRPELCLVDYGNGYLKSPDLWVAVYPGKMPGGRARAGPAGGRRGGAHGKGSKAHGEREDERSMNMALAAVRRSIFGLVVQLRRGGICYIGGSETLPPPLTREEELAYMRKMADDDPTARATLIERNLRLVVYIARKFENTGIGIEDLISIGAIGLIKAVNSFDPEKNIKLATYASRCIENEILMVLRRTSRLKLEVSFDEPAQHRLGWQRTAALGHTRHRAGSGIARARRGRGKTDAGRGGGDAHRPRARHRAHALRPGRRRRAHAKGSRRQDGHLAELHIAAGKAHHRKTARGDRKDGLKRRKSGSPRALRGCRF